MTSKHNYQYLGRFSQISFDGNEDLRDVDKQFLSSFIDKNAFDDEHSSNDVCNIINVSSNEITAKHNGDHQELLSKRSIDQHMLDFADVEPAAELTNVFDEELMQTSLQETWSQLYRLTDSMKRSAVTRNIIICQRQTMLLTHGSNQLNPFRTSASSYTSNPEQVTCSNQSSKRYWCNGKAA
jgi:hypothetical protein